MVQLGRDRAVKPIRGLAATLGLQGGGLRDPWKPPNPWTKPGAETNVSSYRRWLRRQVVWSTDLARVHPAVSVHDSVPHRQPNHQVADNQGHDPERQVHQDVHSENVAPRSGSHPSEASFQVGPGGPWTGALMPR